MSAEGGQLVDQSSQTASTFPLDLKESSFTHYMSFLLHTKGSVSRKRKFLSKKIPTFLLNTLVPSLKNFCVRPFIYETPVKHHPDPKTTFGVRLPDYYNMYNCCYKQLIQINPSLVACHNDLTLAC